MSAAAPTGMDDKEQRGLVKELAEAVSTQAKVANRTWLALMTVSLYALIPHTPTDKGNISLPFNLGDVPLLWFSGLVFSFLVVLAIAFASAHSQQVRAQKLAHSVIDSLGESLGPRAAVHPREYFDMLREPSLNRIASLAQSLRGQHQFFVSRSALPNWLRLLTVIYYGLLKVIAFIIYFLLPVWALWQAHKTFSVSGLLHIYNLTATWVAGFALLQVLWLDILYAAKILKYLWSSAR